MNINSNKTFKYMGVVLCVIVVFAALSSFFYWRSDNAVGPNLITAFVGVVISALVTLVLLNGQTKDEEEKERNLKLYNTKLQVYSDFVYDMYEFLRDNQVTEEEFSSLRTRLLGKVCFYVNNKDVLERIKKELDKIKELNDIGQMAQAFAGITGILQEDLDRKNNEKEVLILWGKFEEISGNTKNNTVQSQSPIDAVPLQIKNENDHVGYKRNENSESNIETNNVTEQSESTSEDSQRLKKNTWHFNAWGDEQFKRIEENFAESKEKEIELSLVEYGEYWRTNLLKQVGKDDVIMLFRRGGNGYVGAFKAIGRRIFDFEKGEEEILYFEENKPRPVDNFDADVEKYDIYKSRGDGATLCSNLIVKRIAYVPEGVGNPGGVYRRTISRYDSHYAWLLQKRFQKQGQWPEEE